MSGLRISHIGTFMLLSYIGNIEKETVPSGRNSRKTPGGGTPDGGLPWNQKAMRSNNSAAQKRTAIQNAVVRGVVA
jgi:hypothetical protein